MRKNKFIFFLIFGIIVSVCSQIALADEIIVEDADAVWDLTLDNATDASTALGSEAIAEEAITAYNLTLDNATNALIMLGDEIIVVDAGTVWNLTLDNATSISRLVGEPGIMVTKYADTLTYYLLENATDVGRLVGEPGVMVTKYADTLTYYLLENATDVGRLVGEPDVMVTKYADTFTCYSLENATEVQHLVGEPGVMVTKYADTFTYEGLEAPPFDINVTEPIISDVSVTNITLTSATVTWITDEVADSLVKYGTGSWNYTLQKYDSANVTSHSVNLIGLLPNTTYYFVVNSTNMNGSSNESAEYTFSTTIGPQYFDTGKGAYPSIMGVHNGTIMPSDNITVNKMYTYPCAGTGGHTESIELYETETGELIANGTWNGYKGDWHNITIHNVTGATYVMLLKGHEYNYTIRTGSYPQIIHEHEYDKATGGTITCTQFIDANGKVYTDRIPAIKLWAA